MIFKCPICRGELSAAGGSARCARGHSFDKSRYGYYNLLVGRGGAHGDNKEMVNARREFLSSGAYMPLALRVAALAAEHTPDGSVLLDAGSGEGYYTAAVREALISSGKGCKVLAFDISRDAVRECARRGAADEYAVASSYAIPLADASVGCVINVFSPLAIDEMRRIIPAGGRFIMAIPGEEHLFGLKAKIYDTPYKNKVEDTDIEGFRLVGSECVRYPLVLDSAERVRSLFMMTPYAYRTGSEGRARVMALDRLECEAHFIILVYEREGE